MRTSVVVLGIVYSTYRNGRHFSIGQDPLERRQRNPYIPSPLLFDASPAIAGMQLFLRGAKFLYCVEQSE